MPSDHETAAREQRVEALAKHLSLVHFDGQGCGTYDTNACSSCHGPSPMSARDVAEEVLRSPAMRDLLAEAKADALREAADFCAPVYADSLGAGGGDFADGWRQASALFLAELRDRAANPYRETTTGGRDD